jgi:3-deoxy-D-manno-octulosonic-acid transferase
MSPLLRAYLAFSQVSEPIWRLSHRKRLKTGKETAERLPEKYGIYPVSRTEGALLWFHALSVGESLALLPLIEKALADLPEAHVVLTTSTATSQIALEKAALPPRARHVLLPIDTARATRAFLDHWRPDVAVFAELDFWPRLMIETHRRGTRMILVNSRMQAHNFERRRKLGGMMRDVLGLFDRLLVQDGASRDRFVALGADASKIEVAGALKAAARPLAADETELATLRAAMGNRPVWLAAATIAEEHAAMIEAHRVVAEALPDALLILAPRNTRDGDEAERLARAAFAHVARRTKDQPIVPDTQVYIADTIGEMGLWYRLAPVSFVGHSLGAGLEGKNPFEAAALGSAILHGPDVSYFAESYDALAAEGGALQVTGPQSLAAAVLRLRNAAERRRMTEGAARVIETSRGVLDRTWNVIRDAIR